MPGQIELCNKLATQTTASPEPNQHIPTQCYMTTVTTVTSPLWCQQHVLHTTTSPPHSCSANHTGRLHDSLNPRDCLSCAKTIASTRSLNPHPWQRTKQVVVTQSATAPAHVSLSPGDGQRLPSAHTLAASQQAVMNHVEQLWDPVWLMPSRGLGIRVRQLAQQPHQQHTRQCTS